MIRTTTQRLAAAMLIATALSMPMAALGAPVNLSDGNSSMTIFPDPAGGIGNWVVDGVHHLAGHIFFYRVGAAGGEDRINNLFIANEGVSGTDVYSVSYTDGPTSPTFRIDVTYTLQGGGIGSGSSAMDITAQITSLIPTGGQNLDFHFFQYADFDLAGNSFDTSVQILGGPVNSVRQEDAGLALQETVTNAGATPIDHYEVAYFSSLIASLQDASPTTLADVAGPLTNGDLTWALQWDFTLAPGQTVSIVKDFVLTSIPEPSMFATLAFAGLAAFRRR
jgi:hypothetical protein